MIFLEEKLKAVRAEKEGILSISMSANGSRDYSDMYHRADYLLKCGMNQLLIISFVPEVMKLAPLASAEQVEVRKGIKNGLYQDMAFDTISAMRNRYPDLPIITTPMVGDMIAYGTDRFINRVKEAGGSGWDTANYQAISDVLGIRKKVQENGLGFITAVFSNLLDMNKREDRETIRDITLASSGEMFVVPAVPGTANGLRGEYVKPVVEFIREVQDQAGHRIPLIGIGGISTVEDAYEMVRVAGMDGIHFSSAYMKKMNAGYPEEEIIAWLKEVKAAMRG